MPPPTTTLTTTALTTQPLTPAAPPPPVTPLPPPPPPFDIETTLNALVVVAGKPRCEPWTISPDASTPSKGTITAAWTTSDVPYRLELRYVVAGAQLSLEGYQRKVADVYAGSGTCGNTYAIAWDGSELAVDSARWFASPEACQEAIDTGRRVAMDVGDCGAGLGFRDGDDLRELRVGDDVRAESLRRFKYLLRKGGKLYVADEDDRGHLACTRLRVSKGGNEHGGAISWIDTSEESEPWRVTASIVFYGEPVSPHGGSWIDPDYGVTYQEISVSNGHESLSGDEGFGLGCVHISRIWGLEDGVEIAGNPHYFSRRACKRANAREVARRRWFPTDEDQDVGDGGAVSAIAGPGIGGC